MNRYRIQLCFDNLCRPGKACFCLDIHPCLDNNNNDDNDDYNNDNDNYNNNDDNKDNDNNNIDDNDFIYVNNLLKLHNNYLQD